MEMWGSHRHTRLSASSKPARTRNRPLQQWHPQSPKEQRNRPLKVRAARLGKPPLPPSEQNISQEYQKEMVTDSESVFHSSLDRETLECAASEVDDPSVEEESLSEDQPLLRDLPDADAELVELSRPILPRSFSSRKTRGSILCSVAVCFAEDPLRTSGGSPSQPHEDRLSTPLTAWD